MNCYFIMKFHHERVMQCWIDFIYVSYARWHYTECLATHGSKLQPSVNQFHASVINFMLLLWYLSQWWRLMQVWGLVENIFKPRDLVYILYNVCLIVHAAWFLAVQLLLTFGLLGIVVCFILATLYMSANRASKNLTLIGLVFASFITGYYISTLAFPADIGRKPASPARGNAYTPARAGFVGDAYTPANETADLVSLNMAAPVRTVSDMRDNPKTLIRSGVSVYNYNNLFWILYRGTYASEESVSNDCLQMIARW